MNNEFITPAFVKKKTLTTFEQYVQIFGMKAQRLAEIGNISMRHAYYILSGARRPSVALAERLEVATGVPAQAWLFPDRYPNIFLDKDKVEVLDPETQTD